MYVDTTYMFVAGVDEVITRVSHGLRRGEHDFGVMTRSILCAQYRKDFNTLHSTLKQCQAHFQDGVVGMDLLTLQPEQGFIGEWISSSPFSCRRLFLYHRYHCTCWSIQQHLLRQKLILFLGPPFPTPPYPFKITTA